jgi:hypothetical protein
MMFKTSLFSSWTKAQRLKLVETIISCKLEDWIWACNKVGAVHTIILAIIAIVKYGTSAFALLLFVGILYNVCVKLGAERKLRMQRRILEVARQLSAKYFGFNRLLNMTKNDWETYRGWTMASRLCLLLGGSMLFSFILEGNVEAIINMILIIVYVYAANQTKSQAFVYNAVRINLLNQFLTAVIWPYLTDEKYLRRATLTRVIISMSCFEGLDEIFFFTVVLMSVASIPAIGFQMPTLMLQLRCFFMVTAPSELLGVRYVFAKLMWNYSAKAERLNQLAIVACSVPTTLIYISYITETSFSYHNITVPLNAILSIVSYVRRHDLASTVQPTLSTKKTTTTQVERTYIKRSFFIMIGICIFHGLIIEGLTILILGLLLRNVKEDYQGYALLSLQMALLLFPSIRQSDSAAVMLVSARVKLAFEDRPFNEMAWECFALNAVQISLAPPSMRGAVTVICWYCSVITLAMAIMRENASRLMNLVKRADSFLDHALKQKFSSVGAAISQALESTTALDHQSQAALKKALRECRKGQNSCYLSAYAIQYQAGVKFPEANTKRNLLQSLRDWSDSGELPLSNVCYEPCYNNDPIEPTLNWDVLKALLFDICKEVRSQTIEDKPCEAHVITAEDGSSCQIQIRLYSSSLPDVTMFENPKEPTAIGYSHSAFIMRIRRSAASSLGGHMVKDRVLEIQLHSKRKPGNGPSFSQAHLKQELQINNSPSLGYVAKDSPNIIMESMTEPVFSPLASESNKLRSGMLIRGSCSLPSGLVVAVLDDSKLVRSSLLHIFQKHAKSSPDSFVTGASAEEARFFPHQISLKHVDIAIFDENLDYNNENIKGTALAIMARKTGFRKCAILHSANHNLAKTLDPAFNGFVEKTSSREYFLKEVAHVWEEFVRQRNNPSPRGKQDGPSSTGPC